MATPLVPRPWWAVYLLALGLALAGLGAAVATMDPTAGFYLMAASAAIGNFAGYLGWAAPPPSSLTSPSA